MLLYFESEAGFAQKLAAAAHMPCALIESHRFPDGELKLRLPERLPERVCLLRSLHDPNEKLVELLLCGRAARQLGAQALTLIAPYLAYMRQDMAFSPGEVVSQRVVGEFLASLFDAVLTVDPHLHRIDRLDQAISGRQTVVLSGAPLLADLIAQTHTTPLLIGPDEESAQWVGSAASRHGFDSGVCTKVRRGDRDVAISLPALPIKGRNVVLMDDVASSGETLIQATRMLIAAGAQTVDVAVTHALFVGDALSNIQRAGVRNVWSTDCVAHETNAVSITNELAKSILSL